MQCTHTCIYVSLHMHANVYILCECLYAWAFMFVPVCMFVCLFSIPYSVFWDISSKRLRIKSQGLRRKGWRIPGSLKFSSPIPHLEVVSPIDSKGKMNSSQLIPPPLCLNPALLPSRRPAAGTKAKPLEDRDWGKAYVGRRGNFRNAQKGKQLETGHSLNKQEIKS